MHKIVWIIPLSTTLSLPVLAQNYHYSYGSSRVVNQSQSGLYRPSPTYLSPGTLSRSAQGLPPGISSGGTNPMLPQVNMGANVRTPGDYLYWQPQAVPKQQTGLGYGLPSGRLGANVGTPGDRMRSDLRYYYPGQNLTPGNQGYSPTPSGQFIYRPGGVATYAEQTYSSGQEQQGARRF